MHHLGLIYAAAAWGATFVLIKAALPVVHPLTLVGYRFLLATVVMAAILFMQRKPLFKDWKKGWALGWRVWLCYVPQVIGLMWTSASNSGFITGLYMAFVPIVGWAWYRQRPSLVHSLAIGISLAGLWVLTGGVQYLNRGDLITLMTAFGYALWLIEADRYAKDGTDMYIITFQQLLIVAVSSLVIGGLLRVPMSVGSAQGWWILVGLAVVSTVSTHLVQMKCQQTVEPAKVALILSLEPAFAAGLAWTWGGETFAWHQAVGGALIILAIVVPDLWILKNRRVIPAVIE